MPAGSVPTGRILKPIADRTNVGLEVTAGPVSVLFATDGTSVSISPQVALKVVGVITVANPNTGPISGSIGGDIGQGFLVGGSLPLGSGGKAGVRGAALRMGVGVELPLGLGKLVERLGMAGVDLP